MNFGVFMRKIEVFNYDPSWPDQYKDEKQKIVDFLGNAVLAIEHVGSTSVPGMVAKKDIDIVLMIDKLENAKQLEKIGYTFKGEYNVPLRAFLSKNTEDRKVNLHVCEKDHGFFKLQVCFRDYLRAHPEAAKEYSELKTTIVKRDDAGKKHRGWISTYGILKNRLIKNILKKASFQELTINFCAHDDEIEAVKELMDRKEILWPWENPDKRLFIFYKGWQVVGCMFFDENEGLSKGVYKDSTSENDKKKFEKWAEKWSKNNSNLKK